MAHRHSITIAFSVLLLAALTWSVAPPSAAGLPTPDGGSTGRVWQSMGAGDHDLWHLLPTRV